MSKVIFLDIDGVLNSNFHNGQSQKEISGGTLIDQGKIKLLAQLVQKTNAEIVLHSGWRFWFESSGVPLRPEAENLYDLTLNDETVSRHQVKPNPAVGLTLQDIAEAENILEI